MLVSFCLSPSQLFDPLAVGFFQFVEILAKFVEIVLPEYPDILPLSIKQQEK